MRWAYNVGITVFVEADDLDEADQKAYDWVANEYGRPFAKDAWYTEAECI